MAMLLCSLGLLPVVDAFIAVNPIVILVIFVTAIEIKYPVPIFNRNIGNSAILVRRVAARSEEAYDFTERGAKKVT